MTRFHVRATRRRSFAVAAVLAALSVVLLGAGAAGAAIGPTAAPASTPQKSGTVTLTATSGSVTGTVGLGLTPATGAGKQVCDKKNETYALLYLSAVGDEYGVAGVTLNYTVLAPSDGSSVPAGGTLTQYLPTVVPPLFPATAGGQSTPIDTSVPGTYSLGVRCQNGDSSKIFQNYWTTVTISHGTWTAGGTVPTSPSTTSTSVTTTTTSGPTKPTPSGTLTITPASGPLLSGKHTLKAVPAAGSAAQPCGSVQAFALLYFTHVGDEYQPAGKSGVVLKARPLQAAGLDIPKGGSLVDFLTAVGSVDFSQSLGADTSWQQTLAAGKYSLGVRCQSGTASSPTIYQNYFSTVDVAADGTWSVEGSTPPPTTTPTSTTTSTPTPMTVGVVDDAGHQLSSPITLKQGQRVFVSATGFDPAESVTVAIHSTPVTLATVAAVNGGIAAQIIIPATASVGAHQLSFTGATSHRVSNLDFTVAAAATGTTTTTTHSSTTSSATSTVTSTTSSTVPTSTQSSGNLTSTSTTSSTGYSSSTLTSSSYVYPNGNGNANANAYSSGSSAPSGALAYTGYPAANTVDLSLLLLGSGIGVLALTAGFPAAARRDRPRDGRPERGTHASSRRGA